MAVLYHVMVVAKALQDFSFTFDAFGRALICVVDDLLMTLRSNLYLECNLLALRFV
jgi:hypothetical protein